MDFDKCEADDTYFDLSSLAEMVELKELKVVFEGHFAVIGVEQLWGMENMKTLSLVSSRFGPKMSLLRMRAD